MATFRDILDTETDAEAAILADLMKALAENPVAIAEGAAGSTKISGALLRLGNVLDIGSYVIADLGTTTTALHATVAGSALNPCGVIRSCSFSISNGGSGISSASGSWNAGEDAVALSGTWACRGRIGATSASSSGGSSTSAIVSAATLWQRVA